MFHGTLQRRIVFTFLSLLLAIQAVSFLLIRSSIDHNARQALDASLSQGAQVFTRVLQQNADHLLQTTQVLAQDYGFRSAVASDDRPTIASALANHGERVGASIAVFTDAQFNVKASQGVARDALAQLRSLGRDQMSADADGAAAAHVVLLDGQPYQVVAVPVRAPLTIGWVFMGFRVGPALIADACNLAGVDAGVFVRRDKGWSRSISTLGAGPHPELRAYLDALPASESATPLRHAGEIVSLAGDHYLVHPVPLAAQGRERAVALLLKSVDRAVAPYHRLQWGILALTVIGLALFALGSAATAKHITTPLNVLTQSARRLGQGDYSAPIPRQGDDEIGELARAFESMRQTVRSREEEIRHLAFNDSLTQLPNRLGFRTRLTQTMETSRSVQAPFALLKIDLDRFRQVNDMLGYQVGDELLRVVAEQLKPVLRHQDDMLARLGGNEFAIVLHHCTRPGAEQAAAMIHDTLEQPQSVQGHRLDVRVGVGVALYPEHAADAVTLMRYCELALHHAKRRKIPTAFYTDDMDMRGQHSLSQLGEMRAALDAGHMQLFVQPQVNVANGAVLGAEGLLRWVHPERGIVPPMSFIPFAEQTGFVRQLTAWILRDGARVVRQWQDRGLDLTLSLNLSAYDLSDFDLIDKLRAALDDHGVSARSFCLEITECSIMEEPQRSMQTLALLHEMGVRLAIDDFGTGYSSLAYLKRLPVDELKIDKSFVMNMERDLQDAKIVRSTIDLAHNLGLKVVSEGIESANTWKLLQSLACDVAQGYWVAKPMPLADFDDWLAHWERPEVGSWVMPTSWADWV